MTDDDQRLLVFVKERFWARLPVLEEQVLSASHVPRAIERKADKVSDPAVARWLRTSHDPQYVRDRLVAIRQKAQRGFFSDAWLELQSLELRADHSWRVATEPILSAGDRQISAGERGNEMRVHNSFASLRGAEAQARAEEIARTKPGLTWAAIRNKLASEFGVSAETIKKAVRNPKKGG